MNTPEVSEPQSSEIDSLALRDFLVAGLVENLHPSQQDERTNLQQVAWTELPEEILTLVADAVHELQQPDAKVGEVYDALQTKLAQKPKGDAAIVLGRVNDLYTKMRIRQSLEEIQKQKQAKQSADDDWLRAA